jgi:hypothetical protein
MPLIRSGTPPAGRPAPGGLHGRFATPLRRLPVWLVFGLLVLQTAAPARADFVWLGDWSYVASGTGNASFSASPNGSCTLDVGCGTDQQERVVAQRDFRLTGSPTGWAVSVEGFGYDSIYGNISYVDAWNSGYISVGNQAVAGFGSTPWNGPFSHQIWLYGWNGPAMLADGDYTITFSESTSTRIRDHSVWNPPSSGFVHGSIYQVIAVASVPEPAPMALMAIGVSVVVVARLVRGSRPGPGSGPETPCSRTE